MTPNEKRNKKNKTLDLFQQYHFISAIISFYFFLFEREYKVNRQDVLICWAVYVLCVTFPFIRFLCGTFTM